MTDHTKILEEEAEWRAARDQERATRETARTIGLMAMIDVGWTVWSNTDGAPDEYIKDDDDQPVGGIVLTIGAQTRTDPETGEMTRLRSFTTIDPANLKYHVLTEKQVDRDTIAAPSAHLSLRTISYLAKTLASATASTRPKNLLANQDKWLATVATMAQLAAGLRRGMGS